MDTYTPLETSIIFEVPVLLDSTGIPPVVHLSQYDRSIPVLALKLSSSTGKDWSIPEGATGNVQMYKPDKTGVYTPVLGCSEDKKTVYVPVVKQMTAAAGIGRMAVEILTDDDAIHTGVVVLDIAANPIPEGAYESSDDYKTLKEIIDEVQGAAETATSSASAAQASATAAASSQQAAKTSEDAAKKSETAANSSASSASESALNAEESASAAEKSKTEAGSSAAAAKQSQDAAKQSADTASAGAKVITDNKASLDAVADNVEAIQNAASNAQKAQESADAAASDAAKAEAAAKNAQAIAQGQKGYFEDPEALRKAVPTGEDGDWAIVGTTDTIWIWDADTGAWTNSGQNIDLSNYYTKTEAQAKLSGAAGQAVGFDADGNAQAVEVGGRNLLLNSGVTKTGGPAATSWEMAEPGIIDEKYTFSALIEAPEGVEYVDLYRSTGSGDLLLKFPVTPNQKQKVVFTFTNTYNSYAELVRPALVAKPDTLIPLTAYWAKLERGTVATDWSPAPEDIQTELDGKQDKLTLPLSIEQGGTGVNNTAKIEASTNEYFMFSGITSENNPYYDAFRVQMDARTEQPNPPFTFFSRRKSLGTWESQNVYTSSHKPTPADIGAQAKLTGTAGQVVGFDASGAASAVEVGGRNLFPFYAVPMTNGNASVVYDVNDYTIVLQQGTDTTVYYSTDFKKTANLEDGIVYTLSFEAEVNSDTKIHFDFYNLSGHEAYTGYFGNTTIDITKTKVRYVCCGKLTTDETPTELHIRFWRQNNDPNVEVRIKKIKVERGSIATDWTPAPEDKQDAITGTAGQTVGFDADGNAQAVEVGGTNLALDTEAEQIVQSTTGARMGQYWLLSDYGKRILDVVGHVLTISFEAKADVNGQQIGANLRKMPGDGSWTSTSTLSPYVTLTTEYKRYIVSSTVTDIGGERVAVIIQSPPNGNIGKIYVRNAKAEIGSVATDWTPAPEDLQDKLTGTAGQVVGFDASGAAQTAYIGGTNILIDTNSPEKLMKRIDYYRYQKEDFVIEIEKDKMFGSVICITANPGFQSNGDGGINLNYGDLLTFDEISAFNELTFSCLVKASRPLSFTGIGFLMCLAKKFDVTTEWTRITITAPPLPENHPTWYSVLLYSADAMKAGDKVWVKGLKLEAGGVATDWSPAPEDLQKYVDDAVKFELDGTTLKITSVTYAGGE